VTPRGPQDDPAARVRSVVESVQAPSELHARVEADRDRIAARRGRRRAWVAGGAAAAALAALVAALVIVLSPGGAPTVLAAADLSARGPAAPAPARDAADPDALARGVDGVAFPAWEGDVPWRASGERSDTLSGREAATVFYRGPAGSRLAYTIVSGPALAWPEDARRVVRDGTEVWVLRRPGQVVATWRERGHQCVITGSASVPDEAVVALAADSAARTRPGYDEDVG
jgi:hypothetical protein